jgi:hypothetical protein
MSTIENVATAIVGVPLLAGLVILTISTWRISVATVGSMVAFVGFFHLLARVLHIPTAAMPPRREHYALGIVSGAAAGLIFSFINSFTVTFPSAVMGAAYGAMWLWAGHFIRAPFGTKPWPPYPPSQEPGQ